jgi:hypothetical protein
MGTHNRHLPHEKVTKIGLDKVAGGGPTGDQSAARCQGGD